MGKKEGPTRLSPEELAALRQERDELVGKAEQRYAELFEIFYAYQNGAVELVPSFTKAVKMEAQRRDREILSSGEIKKQFERDKLDVYQRAVNEMLDVEKILDPEEAKRIRDKIKKALMPGIQAVRGKIDMR